MRNTSGNSTAEPDHSGKELQIAQLMQAVAKLQRRLQSDDDEERGWMIRNCDNPAVIEFLKESTVMMLHVIDAVGQLEPVNGASISKEFAIPKGSVSKITRRLLDKGILRTELLPDNKKEVLFRTTPLGQEIYKLHQALHKQMDAGIHLFLERYSENELLFFTQGIEDTAEVPWTDPELIAARFPARPDCPEPQEPLTVRDPAELQEITEMLRKLDSRSLRKAKAVLEDVFFKAY
ncbi:hypothetical protein D3C73_1109540 [compost metagenome]